MPRAARIQYPHALYHVTSRGNGRSVIFHTTADRERFLEQLAERVESYRVVIYAFVLMDNHYHLLLRTPEGNLDRFMQRLNTSYALYYRYKHNSPGHVFQGRYKAILVRDDSYLLALSRYIHLNPVKTAEWVGKGRRLAVGYLTRYPWSSYRSYILGRALYPWLSLEVLARYGKNWALAARRYRAFTEAMITENDNELIEALRTFGRAQEMDLGEDKTSRITEGKKVSLEAVDAIVARHFGVAPGLLTEHGRAVGAAKRVAIELGCRLTGCTLSEVGAHYGGISASAVNMARRRLRPEDQSHLTTILSSLQS